jgi:hypothetical protein
MDFGPGFVKYPSLHELALRTETGNNRHKQRDFLQYLGKIQAKPIDIQMTMAYPFKKREVNRCKHTV